MTELLAELALPEAPAEPSPVELTSTSAEADELAVAPSPLSAVPELVASPLALPVPPPVVVTPALASASEAELAEPGALAVVLSPWELAPPSTVPVPVTVPFAEAFAVVSGSVKVAVALPVAEAPGPLPLITTLADALPEPAPEPVWELLVLSPTSSPVAEAPAEELALEPAPSLALELAFPEAEAPAPLALALAPELELAPPPPALAEEWLSADADAALALVALNVTFLTSGVKGVAIKASASALAETMSPNRKLLGRCMNFLLIKKFDYEVEIPGRRTPSRCRTDSACAKLAQMKTENREKCSLEAGLIGP
jgi:hypothetical protein